MRIIARYVPLMITVKTTDVEIVAKGGPPLRDLCRKEVDNFDRYLREEAKEEYIGGLSKFEHLAIEGYLYQKLRGRLDK